MFLSLLSVIIISHLSKFVKGQREKSAVRQAADKDFVNRSVRTAKVQRVLLNLYQNSPAAYIRAERAQSGAVSQRRIRLPRVQITKPASSA